MLMRKETLDYGKMISHMSEVESSRVIRKIIVGERGSGKSMMLLQAMAMAFTKGFVVVNIAEGIYPHLPRSPPFPTADTNH